MASLILRNLDDDLKARLRIQAARRGRSMAQEAREILGAALNPDPALPGSLFESIRARFAPYGGVDLALPPRDPMREPPTFV